MNEAVTYLDQSTIPIVASHIKPPISMSERDILPYPIAPHATLSTLETVAELLKQKNIPTTDTTVAHLGAFIHKMHQGIFDHDVPTAIRTSQVAKILTGESIWEQFVISVEAMEVTPEEIAERLGYESLEEYKNHFITQQDPEELVYFLIGELRAIKKTTLQEAPLELADTIANVRVNSPNSVRTAGMIYKFGKQELCLDEFNQRVAEYVDYYYDHLKSPKIKDKQEAVAYFEYLLQCAHEKPPRPSSRRKNDIEIWKQAYNEWNVSKTALLAIANFFNPRESQYSDGSPFSPGAIVDYVVPIVNDNTPQRDYCASLKVAFKQLSHTNLLDILKMSSQKVLIYSDAENSTKGYHEVTQMEAFKLFMEEVSKGNITLKIGEFKSEVIANTLDEKAEKKRANGRTAERISQCSHAALALLRAYALYAPGEYSKEFEAAFMQNVLGEAFVLSVPCIVQDPITKAIGYKKPMQDEISTKQHMYSSSTLYKYMREIQKHARIKNENLSHLTEELYDEVLVYTSVWLHHYLKNQYDHMQIESNDQDETDYDHKLIEGEFNIPDSLLKHIHDEDRFSLLSFEPTDESKTQREDILVTQCYELPELANLCAIAFTNLPVEDMNSIMYGILTSIDVYANPNPLTNAEADTITAICQQYQSAFNKLCKKYATLKRNYLKSHQGAPVTSPTPLRQAV